jgi:hypothetical protein
MVTKFWQLFPGPNPGKEKQIMLLKLVFCHRSNADPSNRAALAFYRSIGWQDTQLVCVRSKQIKK